MATLLAPEILLALACYSLLWSMYLGMVRRSPARLSSSRGSAATQNRFNSLHRGGRGVFRRPAPVRSDQSARLDVFISAHVRHAHGAFARPAFAGSGDDLVHRLLAFMLGMYLRMRENAPLPVRPRRSRGPALYGLVSLAGPCRRVCRRLAHAELSAARAGGHFEILFIGLGIAIGYKRAHATGRACWAALCWPCRSC